MPPVFRIAPIVLPAALMLSGCVASTIVAVATAPIKVASKAADLATTSQSEADQTRGREIRKREEHLGKLERDYQKASVKCDGGDGRACTERDAIYAEMQTIMPSVPVES